MKWHKNKEFGEEWFHEILTMTHETDCVEFKRELNLFVNEKRIDKSKRDEFIKDILGLTNGNCYNIRFTKYLIIGVDNNKEDIKERFIHPIDYKLPSQSEISTWLKGACTPIITGIEIKEFKYQNKKLFVISIPPSFDLHETTRELITSKATFQKYTVFMRQDEHTTPASVSDGITIQQRKHLFRQEVKNLPTPMIGILIGGIVAFIIGKTNIEFVLKSMNVQKNFLLGLLTILGIFFGYSISWISQQFLMASYDWRYFSSKQKIYSIMLSVLMILCIVLVFMFFK